MIKRYDVYPVLENYKITLMHKYSESGEFCIHNDIKDNLKKHEEEKKIRKKYQDIVYDVCGILDKIKGNDITKGEGIVIDDVVQSLKQVQSVMGGMRLKINEDCIVWHSVEETPIEVGDYWVLDQYDQIDECTYYDTGWPYGRLPNIRFWAIPKPPKGE